MNERCEDYKPRFSFEISEEQNKRWSKLVPQYGLKKAVFSRILDEVMDIVEEEGPAALGILISGRVKPSDIIPVLNEAREVSSGNLQDV